MEAQSQYLPYVTEHPDLRVVTGSGFLYILRLNRFPWCVETTFCLFICPRMDIWVASTSWPL